jgi:SAM-dependent methyltransferase
MDMTKQSEVQKELYESIHEDYERHYYDGPSMAYRHEFIYDPMFGDADLNGKLVADLACGSGHNSVALRQRYPGVTTIGFDISDKACADYARNNPAESRQFNLCSPTPPGIQVDAAMIVVGLHHCVSDLDAALRNIASLVKPGGHFYMVEPSSQCFLELARKIWYRFDRYFDADTEAALNHDRIAAQASRWFDVEFSRHMGGPAYFLILNSLLFRISGKTKERIAPAMFASERLYNRLPGKFWFPYFVCRWKRNDVPA